MEESQWKLLFGNIYSILSWNMEFLSHLRPRLDLGSDCFGDILVTMIPFLKPLYIAYNENYEMAQYTYRKCIKRSEFADFMSNRSKMNASSTDMLSSLHLPIQRLIMYDSLLKEIISLTPIEHPDYADLCTAYRLMRAMERAANRVVDKRRNMDMVLKIQESLIGVSDY
eukprot:TRINITY_DN1296_c0_g1_i1.p1 TRINITY_DN1296_c0_g1~~TRINITY_DN1296_c0_g1_i1.p1  ORF type:complete len:169 (+),score=32.25 TRINITY_DN1296_c0_g1_i1:382-888(+)